jgi:ATP-binding cassette subfamily B protein
MIFGKTINKYYLKYIHMFLLGLVALVLVDWFQLEIPEVIRTIIDSLAAGTISKDELVTLALKMLGFAGIIVVGRFAWRIFILGASRKIEFDLRNSMYDHCEKLDQGFYGRSKTGGLMAHFINDLEAVRQSIGFGMIMIVDAVFLGLLSLYKMFNINVMMTILALVPLIIVGILGSYLSKLINRRFKDRQKAFEDMSDFVNENMSGIQVIKAFVKEPIEKLEFLKRNKDNKDKTYRFVKLVAIVEIMMRGLITTITVIIIGYGAYLITSTRGTSDVFTYGMLYEYISYFFTLIWPMIAVVRVIQIGSSAKASLERIDNILTEEIIVKDTDVVDAKVKGAIEFKNVSFAYPDSDIDQLKNISFKIDQGDTVGIIGRTGSGKTTLVDLLLRIYNIDEDKIIIDGNDIMRIPLKTLRNSIGYVPQDGFLFSDSLYNNIALGIQRDGEYYEQVISSAKRSDVHENIMEFPEGYDTVIGERGVTLSGGQKQRVSIARALIKDPEILIMDDSVSAVDTKTEEIILGNLKEVRDGKTTIIIAHRISSIKNANKIILIDEGEVMDMGTHDELMSRCELYIDIVTRQELEDEIEGVTV